MDREELTDIIRKGPVRITMNDGSSYVVNGPEMAVVSDIAASILHKCEDGKWRNVYLPLVTMASIEPLDVEAK